MCFTKKTVQKLQLGDRVRVKSVQTEFALETPDEKIIAATVGSLGIIVSFDEYCWHMEQELRRRGVAEPTPKEYKHRYSMDEKNIKRGIRYPVKWTKVMQVVDSDVTIWCKEGEIQMIASSVLEKVDS